MKRPTAIGTTALTIALLVVAPSWHRALVMAQTSLPELIQRVKPSVAWVIAQSDRGKECGSAFAVDASGLLVTALHVVKDAQSISVQFPSNDPVPADVVGVNVKSDLAILRIGQRLPVSLPIADSIQVGQDAIIIGYPLCSGPDPTVTKGIVSGLNRVTPLGGGDLIQIDAAMNPGDSGGPVLTNEGTVIGVADQSLVRAGGVPAQAVNFAVSNDAVKALVTKVMDPAQPHPALTLPLQETVTGQVHYKGSANVAGKIVKDVICVPPPPGALSISAVHGELNASAALVIKTILTLRTNPDEPSVGEFGTLAQFGSNQVQRVDQSLPDLPARDVCLSYLAQSTLNQGILGLIPLGFEVTYIVDYKVWSPQITGVPLPAQAPAITPPQQAAPERAMVTWTIQPNGEQVRVALEVVVPADGGGVRQAVKIVSVGVDGHVKTVYEGMDNPGDTVSVSTSDVPPFVIQVYVAGRMVKQITVTGGRD